MVKTVAVLPGRRYAGLGRHLVETAERRAAESGVSVILHASMREGGKPDAFSRRRAQTIRRYALYRRSLI